MSFSHRLEETLALPPVFKGKQKSTLFFGREITMLLRVIFDGVASHLLVQDWAVKVAEGRAWTTRRLLGTKKKKKSPTSVCGTGFLGFKDHH